MPGHINLKSCGNMPGYPYFQCPMCRLSHLITRSFPGKINLFEYFRAYLVKVFPVKRNHKCLMFQKYLGAVENICRGQFASIHSYVSLAYKEVCKSLKLLHNLFGGDNFSVFEF